MFGAKIGAHLLFFLFYSAALATMLRMMKNWLMAAVAVVAGLLPAHAAEWMTDFEAAKAKAAKENKAVLVDFTGSDWCHFCNVLRLRVLDTPAFEEYGADKFVYLEVDLPRTTRLPEKLLAQNNALVNQYEVGGFPTVILLDAQGHALGGFTGGLTRLPDVIKSLEPAWQVFQHLKAAETEPTRRAEHLAAAYALYPDAYRKQNEWLQKLLEEADPQDKTGWRTTLAAEKQMQQLQDELLNYVMSRHAVVACYDRYLEQALPGNRARILALKSRYLNGASSLILRRARTVDDVLLSRDLQLQAAACEENPTEREELIRRIHEAYAHPESLLPKKGDYVPR